MDSADGEFQLRKNNRKYGDGPHLRADIKSGKIVVRYTIDLSDFLK